MEVILTEWESFARRFWVGPLPDSKTLRNHAQAMLNALVQDMATPQSLSKQKGKSEGSDSLQGSALNQAAVGHALTRVNDGFDIRRMVAEFRALRASVNRIWWESVPVPHKEQIDDMGRFHEALDQLVAASVTEFTERVDKSRRLFLGILGHDFRQPLTSVMMFVEMAKQEATSVEGRQMLADAGASCASMAIMLNDLLDFTSSQLGVAIPIQPTASNIETICLQVLNEVRATAPGRTFELKVSGNLNGEWDSFRLRQLISNLLSNTIQHGSKDGPITTTLRGGDHDVILTIHNFGQPIPQDSIRTLFDPMVRLPTTEGSRPHGSIGLGLYICRMIAVAHGGEITVDSSFENGTTFTVRLPRRLAINKSE